MSVINKVLQDIDQQKTNITQQDEAELSYQKIDIPAPAPAKLSKSFIISLLVLLVLGASVWGYLTYFQTSSPAPQKSFVKAFSVEAEPKSNVLEEQAESATQIDNAEDETATSQTSASDAMKAGVEQSQVEKPIKMVEPAKPVAMKLAATTPAKPKQLLVEDVVSAETPVKPQTAPVRQQRFVIKPTEKSNYDLAAKALQRGDEAQSRGRFIQAESEYKKALKLQPDLHDARAKWVSLLYGEADQQQAIRVLQQAIDNYPEHTGYRLLLARIYQELGQSAAALHSLTGHSPLSNVNEYHQLTAALAQQNQQWQLALEHWQILLLSNRPRGKWLLGAAIAFEKQNKLNEAEKHYKQALQVGGLSNASLIYIQQKLAVLSQQSPEE
ncbi:hypothetical protein C2869_21505 [Saccharobesus litoralis]|uniref:Uncharacterized protein n=1 Tax=Saccharobesus litoralis TaxID=2172099 RepID=A0A2S0VX63_9ALTE|nr:tetratricopeptide repeat protein [Saccharobesus litoralis]AWB68817.1 hypothetical protein C2869_21505 [Saccharobesus litoralis]